MKLYIIRHAQSTNNILTDHQGRVSDPPLTELGSQQGEILAQHLATGPELKPPVSTADGHDQHSYGLTRLYCSPMWRALQTADPIGRALGLTPEVWIDIHEWGGIFLDHGDGRGPIGYPGKTRQQIQTAFPHYVLPAGITEQGWWNRGHEDRAACYGRAIKVAGTLREWVADNNQERIAIVSHGGFFDALLKALFNQLPGRQVFYYAYNTAISRIDFESDGRLRVRYLNRVSHLPPELIS
jgi:2,3-bisphosphoglycerate-dependent phosphoglycerate mutase